jgi:hypothetical protein
VLNTATGATGVCEWQGEAALTLTGDAPRTALVNDTSPAVTDARLRLPFAVQFQPLPYEKELLPADCDEATRGTIYMRRDGDRDRLLVCILRDGVWALASIEDDSFSD